MPALERADFLCRWCAVEIADDHGMFGFTYEPISTVGGWDPEVGQMVIHDWCKKPFWNFMRNR